MYNVFGAVLVITIVEHYFSELISSNLAYLILIPGLPKLSLQSCWLLGTTISPRFIAQAQES